MGDPQPVHGEAAVAGALQGRFHGGGGARDHDAARAVVGGDDRARSSDDLFDVGGIGAEAGHGARFAGEIRHGPAAGGRETQGGLGVEGAGPVEGGDLAQAVPHGHGGAQAQAVQQPEAGQRVGEDGRLGHGRIDCIERVGVRIEPGRPVDRLQLLEAPPQDAAVEMRRRALAGEEEADAVSASPGAGAEETEEDAVAGIEPRGLPLPQPAVEAAQSLGGLGGPARHHRGPGRTLRPRGHSLPQLGGEVGQLRPRDAGGHRGQALGVSGEGGGVGGGEQQQLGVLPGGQQLPLLGAQGAAAHLGRPLDHHVGVDAAEAHGGDGGAQRLARGPRLAAVEDTQDGAGGRQLGVRLLAAGVGRQHLVVDGERRLDQPGDAGRRLGVADVGLEGAHDGGERRG